jgi:hypothetical protein
MNEMVQDASIHVEGKYITILNTEKLQLLTKVEED